MVNKECESTGVSTIAIGVDAGVGGAFRPV